MPEILSGEDVTPLVSQDLLREPPGVGFGANEDEQRGGGYRLGIAGGRAFDDQVLQAPLTAPVHDPGVEADSYVGGGLDLFDEVIGHAGRKGLSAHQ